jgi:Holliday junction DNA helicase RuvA
MYDSLRGRVLRRGPTELVLDVGGVGFLLEISLRTAEKLPRTEREITVLVHARVQEDRHRLFGFCDEEERSLFRELLRVAGIGPATALALVSGMEPVEAWRAIAAGEWKPLARTRGIGARTAQRICTDLKDRARRFLTSVAAGAAGDSGLASRREDLVAALLVLGYGTAPAEAAATKVMATAHAEAPVEELVRAAIQSLAR